MHGSVKYFYILVLNHISQRYTHMPQSLKFFLWVC